jgi:TolA-binding protein
MIVERYPQYSQTDKVLLLLGGVNVSEGNPDEAARYYQRIINEFPASQYVGEAYHRLAAIEGVNYRVSPKP